MDNQLVNQSLYELRQKRLALLAAEENMQEFEQAC